MVSGSTMLVCVMKLSDIVVKVMAGCVYIKIVVEASWILVMIKVSVEAGKYEV